MRLKCITIPTRAKPSRVNGLSRRYLETKWPLGQPIAVPIGMRQRELILIVAHVKTNDGRGVFSATLLEGWDTRDADGHLVRRSYRELEMIAASYIGVRYSAKRLLELEATIRRYYCAAGDRIQFSARNVPLRACWFKDGDFRLFEDAWDDESRRPVHARDHRWRSA